MNCAINCENLLNFVKVIPKTLLVPFFPDTVYLSMKYWRILLLFNTG